MSHLNLFPVVFALFLIGFHPCWSSEEEEKKSSPTDQKKYQFLSQSTVKPIEDTNNNLWASPYSFDSTQKEFEDAVEHFCKNRGHISNEGTFFDLPEYKEAAQQITQVISNFLEHPLGGILGYRLMAKRIASAPIKKDYTLKEKEYLRVQFLGIAMFIQSNMNSFKWITHELRDISEDIYEKDQKILDSSTVASFSQKADAKKRTLYAQIPWRKLESLGLFTDFLLNNSSKKSSEEILFDRFLPSLIQEFRELTNIFANLINFYQDDLVGAHSWKVDPRKSFTTISVLGSFWRDKITLEKIKKVIENLLSKDQPVKLGEKTKRYALLRVLNIIGEGGILLSPELKNFLSLEESFKDLQHIRNAFHAPKQQQMLHTIIFGKDVIYKATLQDLKELSKKINKWLSNLTNIKGDGITIFYNTKHQSNKDQSLQSINNIRRIIDGRLTNEEEKIFIKALEKQFSEEENSLEEVKNMLLNDLLKKVERTIFESNLQTLKLSKTQRERLLELYKKRIVKGESNLAPLAKKEKEESERILTSVKENKKAIITLLQNVHTYINWKDLKQALEIKGIRKDEYLKAWEDRYNLAKQRNNQSKGPQGGKDHKTEKRTTSEIISQLSQKIFANLDMMKTYLAPYSKIIDRTTTYQKDYISQLALEYLTGSFRQDAQNLWEVLSSLKKGNFQFEINLLDKYIQRAKEILHNHSITEISTVTASGQGMLSILTDIPALFGDSFGIVFSLPSSCSLNFSFDSGPADKFPIYDERLGWCKDRFERKYPIHEILRNSSARRTVENQLETMKKPGGAFRSIYDNFRVTERGIIYTHPTQKGKSLQEILLDFSKINDQYEALDEEDASSNSHPISTYEGHDKGQHFQFQEEPIPMDNDCALHCLGFDGKTTEERRKEAKDLLFAESADVNMRVFISEEILEAFYGHQIPKQMQSSEYHDLQQRYQAALSARDDQARQLNEKHSGSPLRADEILQSNISDDVIQLKVAQEILNKVQEEIRSYACSQETYKNFIQFHVGQKGSWLGYLTSIDDCQRTSTLDALAFMKGVNLRIWIRTKSGELKIIHHFEHGFSETVDMFHTNGLTHFNKLTRVVTEGGR